MNDNVELELVPDNVLEIKNRILNEIQEEQTNFVVMALMSAMVEVIVTTGPNLDAALKTVAHMAVSLAESIKACDEAKLCNWNETLQ